MRNRFFWAAVFWTVFIAFMCLIKSSSFKKLSIVKIPYKDKYVHFTFYLVFTLLWYFYLVRNSNNKLKTGWLVFGMAVLYGIGIEICQELFTIGRSADIYDVCANTAGSIIGLLSISFLIEKKK